MPPPYRTERLPGGPAKRGLRYNLNRAGGTASAGSPAQKVLEMPRYSYRLARVASAGDLPFVSNVMFTLMLRNIATAAYPIADPRAARPLLAAGLHHCLAV